jgi:signal transduction histidine kinase
LGYAELLRYGAFGPLEEKQENAASQIIDSAHYLTAMVNELLDQAQAESKSVILHIDNFNVNELVQHVEASMTVLAGKKGLALRTSIAPNVPETLRGDRQRLQQILINLAGNAIKFTQTGEVSIHLYCPDDTHWAMQVADTGAGVAEEAQAYIFEPFRQANNAITRENRGTGLGLSITKQLVELMRGEITLESEVDKGSTFTIILPILKDTEKSE